MLEEPLSEEEMDLMAIAKVIQERQTGKRTTISAEELIKRFNAQSYIDERGGKSPWMNFRE